jgi:aldose 1-epimerase
MLVEAAPQLGGAITRFCYGEIDLFRPAPEDADDVLQTAMFAMAPYVNRIAHGRFSFAGQSHMIRPNMAGHTHPLHGEMWRGACEVGEISPASAVLRFEGPDADWPFPYVARHTLLLWPDGLEVRLDLTNTGAAVMPVSLGLHPFFPRAGLAQIAFAAEGVVMTADDLPLHIAPPPQAWRFSKSRPVHDLGLDHCFTGFDGRVRISWPDLELLMDAPSARFLQVYAPAGADFFCAEPQSAAPDMLNHQDAAWGFHTLAPRESLSLTARFKIRMV